MLGDTAVAVHPEDERYRDLVGEPLRAAARRPPDPRSSPTSRRSRVRHRRVKVTPGHDPNDFELGRAHGLEEIGVIGEDGRMTRRRASGSPGSTGRRGRERRSSRRCARRGCSARRGALLHSVPFSHRSGERIEPLISLQWFCGWTSWRAPAIEVGRARPSELVPESWSDVYLDWLANIQPWCVSRQLWWGHRIPVWYCDACGGRSSDARRRALRRADGRLSGRRRPRHLVQLGALAVRDARLARGDARSPRLLPDRVLVTARRHPLPLGRAHGHDGTHLTGEQPVPRVYLHRLVRARRRAADVEDEGQRASTRWT